jgi:hypothetical protein
MFFLIAPNGAAKFSGDLRERLLSNRYDVAAKNETLKLLVCKPLNVAVVRCCFFILTFCKSILINTVQTFREWTPLSWLTKLSAKNRIFLVKQTFLKVSFWVFFSAILSFRITFRESNQHFYFQLVTTKQCRKANSVWFLAIIFCLSRTS